MHSRLNISSFCLLDTYLSIYIKQFDYKRQILRQEHVSAEIRKKYVESWDPSPNQQARYFFQISARTLFLALSHTFHCFQTHLVSYISKLTNMCSSKFAMGVSL